MGDLGATLIKELNCETAFTIGGIGISESVVVTWIMMAVVLVVSLIVTHGLKVEHPGRGQLLLENAVTWLQGIGEGILGEEGKGYAPYLTSVLMYLGVANLLGILGFKPPTKDLNVTAALALMSIVLDSGQRFKRVVKELYRADRHRDTDQYHGGIYQTVVAVYATVRKRAGRVRHHEID